MTEEVKETKEVKRNPNHCERGLRLNSHLDGHDCGDAIRHAQHLLNHEETGEFDRSTVGAVINFQASVGMTANGEIDDDTLAALHDAHTHCKCE